MNRLRDHSFGSDARALPDLAADTFAEVGPPALPVLDAALRDADPTAQAGLKRAREAVQKATPR